MVKKRLSNISVTSAESIREEVEEEDETISSSDEADLSVIKDQTTMDSSIDHTNKMSRQSTPKLEKSLLTRSNDLIRDLTTTSSMEYSYYVIASPMTGRRVQQIPNTEDMTSRSYSFVSMSSKDSSSSELSTVLQPVKRAPKSRGLLQSVKEKLLAEIENINVELIKMDSEKLVLVNLRNASLLYRDMICQSERNNQGIPNSSKLRSACDSIELKIQDEEHALQDDLSVPNIEQIRKDLKDIVKVCNQISETKTTIKMTIVEELLSAVGKLYGVVDTILVIFYDDINDNCNNNDGGHQAEDTVDGVCSDVASLSPIPSPTVSEEDQDKTELNESKSSSDDEPATPSSLIQKQNGSRRNSSLSTSAADQQTLPLELSGKIEEDLKILQKKLLKAKKIFRGIERLSSGNPKPKSLSICFREINSMITKELLQELSSPEVWCRVIQRNVIDLQKHLLADRPGERELEHIRIIVGELYGRIAVILKSNMLE